MAYELKELQKLKELQELPGDSDCNLYNCIDGQNHAFPPMTHFGKPHLTTRKRMDEDIQKGPFCVPFLSVVILGEMGFRVQH